MDHDSAGAGGDGMSGDSDLVSAARWLSVAEGVLAGKHDDADRSEREAIAIGLRCYPKIKSCVLALNKIDPERKYRNE